MNEEACVHVAGGGAADRLLWLEYVATGGQSHVFGTDAWVVKIPRCSWRGVLGRVLVHPRTPVAALAELGGLLEPFVLLGPAVFRGPEVARGRALAGAGRVWRARWAVVGERHAAGDFLDRRMSRATPSEAADLVRGWLETLDGIRSRGWYVLDFIMGNFVVGGDGRVRLVDAGLLIPARHLRWPSQQVSSRFFVRCLVPDYLRVMEGVLARHDGRAAGVEELRAVMAEFEGRMAAWRAGRVEVPAEMARPRAVERLDGLDEGIFFGSEGVGRKMPLTLRLFSGYTARYHGIPSEN